MTGLRPGGFSEGMWLGLGSAQGTVASNGTGWAGGDHAPLRNKPPRCVPAVTMVVPSGSHHPLEGDMGMMLSLSPGRALLLGG